MGANTRPAESEARGATARVPAAPMPFTLCCRGGGGGGRGAGVLDEFFTVFAIGRIIVSQCVLPLFSSRNYDRKRIQYSNTNGKI
mmetsp:Transcript_244/g.404  ORF Transcript_244/g.404 Transcript_244/m.404 type:complete len:85 (-) Transcript_244:148-402(-)